MRSWTSPHLPALPGAGVRLRLYDTAAGEVRPTEPGPLAGMYVCGITPYDATHIGHAATYLAFDLVHRIWRDSGHVVRYVQNVTDVDDPLLERAERDGEDWRDLAARETQLFRDDMSALRVLAPTDYVGAVDAIPEIIPVVERLLAEGAAYELDGDIYQSVASDPHFGAVSNEDRTTMLEHSAGRGGDPDRVGKKDPLDPQLWRAHRPGEPSWPAPFGDGRPGWHVECAAIALNRLGMGFDVQGGGNDLPFPHHECSASHAQTLTGEFPFAKAYVHAGMLGLDGEKMSKSRGNLVFVSRLLAAGTDPAAIRLALFTGHYRADRPWSDALLADAVARLERWRAAVALPAGPPATDLVAVLRARLSDDLATPAALAAVDDWAAVALSSTDADTDGDRDADTDTDGGRDAPGLVRTAVDALLGIALAT